MGIWLRSLFSWISWVVITLILGTTVAAVALINRSASWGISRPWARILLKAAGISVELRDADKIDPAVPVVYISNHQSYVDILSLIAFMPVKLRFVYKRGLLWLPGLNLGMLGQGHIMVARGKPSMALRQIRRKGVALLKNGESVLIFPTGERSWDSSVGDFKGGAAALAIWAGAPIIPLAVCGSREVLPRGNWPLKSGKVIINIGDPIDIKLYTMKRHEELTKLLREKVAELKASGDMALA